MANPTLPLVLVADTPAGARTVENVLGRAARIDRACSFAEAVKLLDRNPSLVVCGIHFDESRMFDLLAFVKAERRLAVPFACFRDLNSDLGDVVIRGLEIACKAQGAAVFVDLYSLKKRLGIAAADASIRAEWMKLLAAQSSEASGVHGQ